MLRGAGAGLLNMDLAVQSEEPARLADAAPKSILAFPQHQAVDAAQYTSLLYDEMQKGGVAISEYKRYFGANAEADLFHFHWPDRAFRGLGKLLPAISTRGFARFFSTISSFRARGGLVVWTVHNLYPHDFPSEKLKGMYRIFEEKYISNIDGFIFLNELGREEFFAKFPGVSRDRCAVIPHMVPGQTEPLSDDAAPAEVKDKLLGRKMYFLPGQVRRYKNIEQAVALFDQIKDGDEMLLVAGKPVDKTYAKELEASLGGRSDAIFLQRAVTPREIAWCFQNSLATLSLRAPNGNSGVVFDALANRNPVIVNPGAIRDELAALVGADWLVDAQASSRDIRAAVLKAKPPPRLEWGSARVIADQHMRFFSRLAHERSVSGA
jgi:hypothetical protein